ncbi:MAG: winged helix-turn-helix transcriptional regulator [Methanomicrobia archaeon]|nr:winged helix-turn-helix transcriptional regulator [Methanomicrobia archaeon]
MKIEDELLKEVRVLLHPIRYRIVELLAEKPMHINGISNKLGEDRRLVSYHLLTLEEHGFLSSNYEISELSKSKGKAIRKYEVTEKVKEVSSELKKRLYIYPK